MKRNTRKFTKNDAAFTGLEAAIVLIAFVVVAAVFSYVMLGAGFFTSQTSKEVVHTGVDQATSSIELAGDVYGQGVDNAGTMEIGFIKITLQLTAGNAPIDLEKTVISFISSTAYQNSIWTYTTSYADNAWATNTYKWIKSNQGATPDGLLEKFEKVEICAALPAGVGVNDKINLEIKPPQGAILTVTGTAPPSIADGGVYTLI